MFGLFCAVVAVAAGACARFDTRPPGAANLGPKTLALLFGFPLGVVVSWIMLRRHFADPVDTFTALEQEPALGYALPAVVALDLFDMVFMVIASVLGALAVTLFAVIGAAVGGMLRKQEVSANDA
ncbi:hypothetical protein SAMN04488095_1889 [Jannaschia pohangensis]|uniref:Uncharacterized protein n=2 Tax=Jannaschia pohangensis TaxID=390807 RepID=A0A1I3MLH0_9RHOB|nr:hypothetical protein SAMN04488095_1889 [Jannaschia pohangensis]